MKVLGKTSRRQKNKGQASKDGWDAYTSEITLFLKTEWIFLKKLKIALPYDPAIPLLGIYMEKMEVLIRKDTGMALQCSLFTIAKTWKHLNCLDR